MSNIVQREFGGRGEGVARSRIKGGGGMTNVKKRYIIFARSMNICEPFFVGKNLKIAIIKFVYVHIFVLYIAFFKEPVIFTL